MPKVTHCSLKPQDAIQRTSCSFQLTLRGRKSGLTKSGVWRCVGPVRGEHIHRQQRDEERQGREGGSRGWRKFGGSACCGIYIPCLATISIGQDRKYTIEGSSATDKDYPIENKTKQKKTADGLFNI